MVGRSFTRVPNYEELTTAGVPHYAMSTYLALSRYADNTTGICWPKQETIAHHLGVTTRTVSNHVALLIKLGLVEILDRRRIRGKLNSYRYRVLHFLKLATRKKARSKKRSSTRNGIQQENSVPNKRRTTQKEHPHNPPKNDLKNGYWHLFDGEPPPGAQEQHRQEVQEKREAAARRRRSGFDWLFE